MLTKHILNLKKNRLFKIKDHSLTSAVGSTQCSCMVPIIPSACLTSKGQMKACLCRMYVMSGTSRS